MFLKPIVDLLNCFVHDWHIGWQGSAQVLLMTSLVLALALADGATH